MEMSTIQRCHKWAGDTLDQAKTLPGIQTIMDNPRIILYGLLFVSVVTWMLVKALSFLRTQSDTPPATPILEKAASRSFKAPQRAPGGLHPP